MSQEEKSRNDESFRANSAEYRKLQNENAELSHNLDRATSLVLAFQEKRDAARAELLRTAEKLKELDALLAPTGTKEERHDRLIEIAKKLGFSKAEGAFWDDDDPECGQTDLDEMVLLEADPSRIVKANLGIYLNESVFARVKEDNGDHEVLVADTEEGLPPMEGEE